MYVVSPSKGCKAFEEKSPLELPCPCTYCRAQGTPPFLKIMFRVVLGL